MNVMSPIAGLVFGLDQAVTSPTQKLERLKLYIIRQHPALEEGGPYYGWLKIYGNSPSSMNVLL